MGGQVKWLKWTERQGGWQRTVGKIFVGHAGCVPARAAAAAAAAAAAPPPPPPPPTPPHSLSTTTHQARCWKAERTPARARWLHVAAAAGAASWRQLAQALPTCARWERG